jgi:hypothetical protein
MALRDPIAQQGSRCDQVPRTGGASKRARAGLPIGLCLLTWLVLLAPAFAGPPYITDDPEPVELGHWEVYGFSYGGNGHGATSGLGPSLEVNYGAAKGLQLHFIGGFAYDDVPGGGLQMGVSDTELGAKLRFVDPDKDDWYPQVGIFPLVEIPTGNAKRGLGAGEWQEFLPLWLQKDWGDWTSYGGGGYWINPGPGNRDYWFFGWLLQKKITEELTLGGELFHQTANTMDGHASSGFNLGAQYDFTDHDHLLFSAGRGGVLYSVDAAATGYPTTYYIAYQWTS